MSLMRSGGRAWFRNLTACLPTPPLWTTAPPCGSRVHKDRIALRALQITVMFSSRLYNRNTTVVARHTGIKATNGHHALPNILFGDAKALPVLHIKASRED